MNRFAALLDRLAYESGRNAKLRLLEDYFRTTPDPERGYALAAITGALSFRHAKPGLIRALIAERTDPVLFAHVLRLRRRSLGDRRADVAGAGAPRAARPCRRSPRSSPRSRRSARPSCRQSSPRWLDALDETGRWALLKLVTGALRIGVSARLAKTAVAALGDARARRGRAGLAVARPALCRPVRLARRARGAAGERRPGAVPPADALPRHRGSGFREPRPRGFRRRMEMGRHPRAGRGRTARRRPPDRAALFAHRRGHFRRLSRSCRGARFRRRARRRAADHARRARAVLQRAAAAAQPQDRVGEAPRRLPRPSARLRPSGRRRARSARRAVRSAARAARSLRRRGSPRRASTSRRWCRFRPGTRSRRRAPIPPMPGPATMPRRSKA